MRQYLFYTTVFFVTAIVAIDPKHLFVNGQFAPCYFCNGDPDATIANPDLVIDLSELDLPVQSATCRQITDALESGLATEDQCEDTQTDPSAIQAQIDCGCSSVSTVPPVTVVPTATTTLAPTLILESPFATPEPSTLAPSPGSVATDSPTSLEPTPAAGTTGAPTPPPIDAETTLAPTLILESPFATPEPTPAETTATPTSPTVSVTDAPSTLPPTVPLPTLEDVLATSPDFSDLNLLFAASKVQVPFPFTVLGPSNAAFDLVDPNYLNKLLRPRWILHLQNLINKHIALGEFYAETLFDGQVLLMQNNEEITVTVGVDDNGSPFVGFNTANVAPAGIVEVTDIVVESGVVHQINGVLFPNFIDTSTVAVLLNYMRLSTFYDLIALVPGLESILLDGDYTLLAPMNQAFRALGQDTIDFLTDPENVDALNNTLSYHILVEVVPSSQFVDKKYVTLNGKKVTADTCNGLEFNGVAPGDLIDILAYNGIVHSLNGVLSPNAPAPTPLTDMPVPPSKRRPQRKPSSSSSNTPTATPTGADGSIRVRVQDYFTAYSIRDLTLPEPTPAEYDQARAATDEYFSEAIGSTYPNFISVESSVDFTAFNDPNFPANLNNFQIYMNFDFADWKFEPGSAIPNVSELFEAMTVAATNSIWITDYIIPIGGTFGTVFRAALGSSASDRPGTSAPAPSP